MFSMKRRSIFLSNIKKALIVALTTGAFLLSTAELSLAKSKKKTSLPKKSEKKAIESSTTNDAFNRNTEKIQVHSFGVGLGETFLKGDFNQYGDDTITVDLFYSYKASYSFDFLINGHHSKHTYRGQQITNNGLAFAIKGRFYQFDNFSPFCLGGIGFYRPIANRYLAETHTYQESDSKITFGLHAGAGADLTLNDNVAIGILGHYHNPFDVKQNIGSDVEGSYFKLMMTLMYTL